MKKPFILFDFDGVIVDSFQPAFETIAVICPGITEAEYKKRFEGNINDLENQVNVHSEKCRHDINFFEEYVPRFQKQAIFFSGMKEVIIELEKKYVLIIVSSTISSPIQAFLEKHNLAKQFTKIMGNDVHKSKVEKIKMVFEQYGIGPNDCVFVTDTLGDMREASKTGVGSIGVTWGFHSPDTLRIGSPFRLVETPHELIDATYEYFLSL